MDEYISGTRQAGLVLGVSEIRAEGYSAGRAREGRMGSEERLVGRSTAGAAVGMAEEEP
jgi:hypothetical protein